MIFCFLLLIWMGMWKSEFPTAQAAQKPWLSTHLIDTSLLREAWSVIRNEETTLIIESPQKYTHRVARTITILQKGTGEEIIGIPYDQYSTAEFLHGSVYDHRGSLIRKIKKSEIMDQLLFADGTFYHDVRALLIKISGGSYPYTLEYSYEIRYKETMSFQPWFPAQFHQSVENSSLTIQTPSTITVHTNDRLTLFSMDEKMEGAMHTRTWSLKNFPALPLEEDAPAHFDILPVLLIAPSAFQVKSYRGSMNNWKAFGQFLFDINRGREKLSPEMAAKVLGMTEGFSDPVQKIDTLYKWLQQNTRYVSVQLGIGGWQSYDAAYVEKNKFGDCKALSIFMKGMLGEIGIEAWPVIINWDPNPTLMTSEFATPYFNHMMLFVPSQDMWLECTSNYLPTGMIDKNEQDKPVLLITPDGGILSKTPKGPALQNIIHSIDTLHLDRTNRLSGQIKYYGNTQHEARAIIYYKKPTEQRTRFLEQFPLSVEKLETLTWYSDLTGEEAGCRYTLLLRHFGAVSNTRMFLPVNALYPLNHTCDAISTRRSAYVSFNDHTTINEIYIKIPSGFLTEYIPEEKVISHDAGIYKLTVQPEGEYLKVVRTLTYYPVRLQADLYSTVCRFMEDIQKADQRNIVLVSKA